MLILRYKFTWNDAPQHCVKAINSIDRNQRLRILSDNFLKSYANRTQLLRSDSPLAYVLHIPINIRFAAVYCDGLAIYIRSVFT
jgi:hypothetical protein